MRHLRCPQRFLPGLEGGQPFPPGHDASRRAWSSFGPSSFSCSLAVPSHSPSRAAIWPRCPIRNSQLSVASTCPRAARTRGAAGHLPRRSRWTAGELGERGHGQIRQAPSADTRGGPSPTARGPASASRSASPSTSSPTRSRRSAQSPRSPAGRCRGSSPARRNAMTQMRRPAHQAQPCRGRNVTRWCAARGTKPTHYL